MEAERGFTATSFQQYLDEGRLMGSRCVETGEVFVPPRPICPRTHSTHMEWVELSGDATLLTLTLVYIGTTAMIEAGFDRQHPYGCGIVELAEGPRMSAQIIGIDPSRPQDVQPGRLLRVSFPEGGEDGTRRRPTFVPV